MRRVARAVPPGGGVYVAGDLLDLAVASSHDFGRAVIYMLHGDIEYYYDLAVRHDPIVHAFIAYSRRMYDELRRPPAAPRRDDLPPAVRHSAAARSSGVAPTGRCARSMPGASSRNRRASSISRRSTGRCSRWASTVAVDGRRSGPRRRRAETALGLQPRRPLDGPADERRAAGSSMRGRTCSSCRRGSKGFPVALVEAMAAGLPAVVSDIPSGVPEIVETGVNGERPPIGDVRAFAASDRRISIATAAASRGDERRRARRGRRDPVRHPRSRGRLPGARTRAGRSSIGRSRPGRISSTAAVSISRGSRIRS